MDKYLGYFEGVYYINMDSRTDRKEAFEKRAEALSIPVERVSALTASDKEATPLYKGQNDPKRKFKMGCTMSHQYIIRKAKEKGLSNCLIFEDDCVFLDSYKEKIQMCADELKNLHWDLFYLGGEPNNYCKSVSNNLAKIQNGGVYATHAYAVNHTFYDRLLAIKPNQVDTIDILYLNYDKNIMTTLLSKELLAVQEKSYSDLWDTVKDSTDIIVNAWKKFVNT